MNDLTTAPWPLATVVADGKATQSQKMFIAVVLLLLLCTSPSSYVSVASNSVEIYIFVLLSCLAKVKGQNEQRRQKHSRNMSSCNFDVSSSYIWILAGLRHVGKCTRDTFFVPSKEGTNGEEGKRIIFSKKNILF